MVLGSELDHLRAAVVEADRFGGTCLNRGCIPSKMLVVAADAARAVADARCRGVHATLDRVDWPSVRDRIFDRIDPLHPPRRRSTPPHGGGGRVHRASAVRGTSVLEVEGKRITAAQIVVAAGSRQVIPPIPGLDGVQFHTSDTIMRIDEIPASLIVIGGGFIAAELDHVFGAFGAEVSLVAGGPRLLMPEDERVSARFTELAQMILSG